jgi:hypothetical protein
MADWLKHLLTAFFGGAALAEGVLIFALGRQLSGSLVAVIGILLLVTALLEARNSHIRPG